MSRFLRTQTELNKALTEVDRKKERKRNFVSAKTGFLTCLELVFSYFFFSIFYAFKVSFRKFIQVCHRFIVQINIDAGTKAFLCAIYNDLFPCIINPVIMVYGSSVIKRKIYSTIKDVREKCSDYFCTPLFRKH